MADLAEQQPEQSLAEKAAADSLDEKLRQAAERVRVLRESRGKGDPKPLSEQIAQRWGERLQGFRAAIDNPPERAVRLMPDEGDAPTIPESFRHGMVPERFRGITFDSYEPATRSQEAALNAAKFWAERASAGEGCMLALIGPQGTGKSHLLYAAANVVLDSGKRLYARPWYRLADELRYGGKHPVTSRDLEAHEVRRALWDA